MAKAGWYSGAQHHNSPHKSTYSNDRFTDVVVHSIEGYVRTMLHWNSVPTPKDALKVSYHFIISFKGQVHQLVEVGKYGAWHAGNLRDAIQHPHTITWPRFRGTHVNPNSYTVAISAEGFSKSDIADKGSWNQAQHTACAKILQWLQDEYGMDINAETVVGHNMISPLSRMDDPGENFNKEYLLSLVTPPPPPILHIRPPLKTSDFSSWTQAWRNGSTFKRVENNKEIHEIAIPLRRNI